jgi:hopanoid biosynthesis associated protein HpnK
MVRGAAAADAVARAHRLPGLRVGLHLVLVDGTPALPPERIPDLVDATGRLRKDLVALGIAVFLRPTVRMQLRAEIEAQFAAFRATGLTLDHVDAHHHFHVHPTVGAEVLDIGRRYGMTALRIPREPWAVLERIDRSARARPDRLAAMCAGFLERRARGRGLAVADRVFGLAWSGAMNEQRIAGVLRNLRDGTTEIYCHPAVADRFAGAASGYRYVDELVALTAPAVKAALRASGARSGGFSDFVRK